MTGEHDGIDLAGEIQILLASLRGAPRMTAIEHPELVPTLERVLVVLLEVRAILEAWAKGRN